VTAATSRVARLTESDWQLFAGVRLRALADSLGLRDHAQFAVLIDDRPVGLIGAQLENVEAVYLYSLWLDPTARGRGLARPLVAAAVDWARERRARTVTLRVAADNAVARGVYESLGFTLNPAENPSDRGEIAMTLSVR
jgi:ribosomal protein S18 acetylase RimI-like enzyme